MPKAVTVIVKGHQVGTWTTAPYSHDRGLDIKAIYEVPIYEVKVEPSHSFKAVRFGLVNRNQHHAPKQLVVMPDWECRKHLIPLGFLVIVPIAFREEYDLELGGLSQEGASLFTKGHLTKINLSAGL